MSEIHWRSIALDYCLSIAVWMLLGVLLAWQEYRLSLDEHMSMSLGSILLLTCVRSFTVALLTPPIFWIAAHAPIGSGKTIKRGAAYLLGFVPFALTFALVRWCLLPPWYPETGQWGPRTFQALLSLTYTTFADELAVYLAIVIAAHAIVYYRRLQRQELEQLALRQALTQSELQTLQMQIQPHFLFNTLHGIASLVHSDAARAEEMILRLSSLLRHALQQGGSDLVRLEEDLRLAEAYLDIESMRLGDRMAVRWQIEAGTRNMLVPQFMFQLLIENGVKHGVANCRGDGWIEISSHQTQKTLKLEVKNSVAGAATQGMGLGHQNIRTRLALLYGNEARLLFHRKDSVATATLMLPALADSGAEPEKTVV